MAWFRRRRHTPTPAPTTSTALVPVVSSLAIERSERALRMLATQSAQMHAQVVELQSRVDRLASTVLDRLDAPTYDDLMETRMHSARVAAELSRLEVNMAARIDSVRNEIRATPERPRVEVPSVVADAGWEPTPR